MENDLTDLLSKNSNNKLNEKIDYLSESVYKIFNAVQIMIDGIDSNISQIYSSISNLEYKTSCLEGQINYLSSHINELQNKSIQANKLDNNEKNLPKNPAPASQQIQKPNPVNLRREIMDELSEILKKRKMMEANEEGEE